MAGSPSGGDEKGCLRGGKPLQQGVNGEVSRRGRGVDGQADVQAAYPNLLHTQEGLAQALDAIEAHGKRGQVRAGAVLSVADPIALSLGEDHKDKDAARPQRVQQIGKRNVQDLAGAAEEGEHGVIAFQSRLGHIADTERPVGMLLSGDAYHLRAYVQAEVAAGTKAEIQEQPGPAAQVQHVLAVEIEPSQEGANDGILVAADWIGVELVVVAGDGVVVGGYAISCRSLPARFHSYS